METFNKHKIRLASFLLPLLIMAIIFIYIGVYPFGNESLLTIDLGQQYIDFFAEYKHTLLEDPMRIFYSFTRSLGGEMVGVWSYYLLSPFNLLFLIFPNQLISVAVTLIILLKYGFAGLSMGFYLQRVSLENHPRVLLFSTAYALMGFMTTYQFNIIWTDILWLLPLVARALDYFLKSHKFLPYVLILSYSFIVNYYMGYMLSLFLILYTTYHLVLIYDKRTWKKAVLKFIQFTLLSVLSAGLVSFLLGPTFLSLIQSKGNYAESHITFELEYPPQEIISKFFLGAFDFDQLPSGLPPIFIGTLMIIGLYLFFKSKHILTKEKIAASGILILFSLSFHLEFFNLMWHGFQHPNWFNYRFTYLFTFFVILLAYRGTQKEVYLSIKELMIGIILIIAAAFYVYQEDFSYLSIEQIILTITFTIAGLFLVYLKKFEAQQALLALLVFTTLELAINAGITIDRLGYVDHDRFVYAQQITQDSIDLIQQQNDDFYRIEKTYQRSKNDAHQNNYYSISHFGSTFESHLHEFFSRLGLPAYNAYVAYSNGTPLTDALFGVRYMVTDLLINDYPNHSTLIQESRVEKPDGFTFSTIATLPYLNEYPKVGQVSDMIGIHKNPYALPLGFTVPRNILNVSDFLGDPVTYQNSIFNALNKGQPERQLFTPIPITWTSHNLSINTYPNEQKATKVDLDEEAWLQFTFAADGVNPYFFLFNKDNDWEEIEMTINENIYYQYDTYYDEILLNLAAKQDKGMMTVRFNLEDTNEFIMTNMYLNRFDIHAFTHFMGKKSLTPIEHLEWQSNRLRFDAKLVNDELLFLSIPYDKSWEIKVNGKEQDAIPILDSLMGIDLPAGEYHIEMVYHTRGLKEFSLISGLSLIILFALQTYQIKRQHE